MSDGQHITKYITQFTRLATQVRWGTAALRYQFYNGLPTRLKDRISEQGKPDNLNTLKEMAQNLDHRYWERKAKQAREAGTSGKPSGGSKTSDSKSQAPSRSRASQSSKPSTSGAPPTMPSGNTPKGKSGTPQGSKTQDRSHLGPDGKLTPAERTWRIKAGLCLFCAGENHMAADCPKKAAAKARAAQAETPATPETTAPKK